MTAAEMDAWRSGWQQGFSIGFAAGQAAEKFETDQAWAEMARPVARSGQLMARRWRLRGQARTRETFGDPHPGDFTGRGGAA